MSIMPEENIQISVIWPDVEELSVYRANQFIVQPSPGPDGNIEDFVMTVGYLAPPVILGTVEEQQASARALGAVSAKALLRVAMSPGVAFQLQQLLQHQLQPLNPGPQSGSES